MKTITIQISDSDYADLVDHLAKDRPGRAMVAVINPADVPGDPVDEDLMNDVASVAAEFDEAAERVLARRREIRRSLRRS